MGWCRMRGLHALRHALTTSDIPSEDGGTEACMGCNKDGMVYGWG